NDDNQWVFNWPADCHFPRLLLRNFPGQKGIDMKGTKAVLRIVFCLTVIAGVQPTALAAGATVTVDYSKPKQTIAGFGASITWLAGDLNNFSPANQTALLNLLYSTTLPSSPSQKWFIHSAQ